MNEIARCGNESYGVLVRIWERSVLATHDFLDKETFEEIKSALIPDYFPNVELYAVMDNGAAAGFMGLNADKIEMLFIDSSFHGRGYGTLLIDFAKQKGAVKVDVNEQNPSALS